MTRHSASPAAMNHDNNTNKHYTVHITHYTTDWIIVWPNHQSFYLINSLSNADQRLYFLIPKTRPTALVVKTCSLAGCSQNCLYNWTIGVTVLCK